MATTHLKLTHGQVVELGQHGQRPANGVEAGGDLPHGDHGLAAHDGPLRVHVQDVDQVDVDVAHALLVEAAAKAHVGPAGPGRAHGGLAPVLAPSLHLWDR